MVLEKSDSAVQTMLSDTILALCRNTLAYQTEVCVEGLLGITVDKKQVFLVHLNETIFKEGEIAKSKTIKEKTNKRQSDNMSGSSAESDSENSSQPKSKRKRKRKRRSLGSDSDTDKPLLQVDMGSREESQDSVSMESEKDSNSTVNKAQNRLSKSRLSLNESATSENESTNSSSQMKQEDSNKNEDLLFIKEEPKDPEYPENASCSYGPFVMPGNAQSLEGSQHYGDLSQLQELGQAVPINMAAGLPSTSSLGQSQSSGPDQGYQFVEVHPQTEQIVRWVRGEIQREGINQAIFSKAVLNRTQGVIVQVLKHPFLSGHQRHIWTIAQFMTKPWEERVHLYNLHRENLGYSETARTHTVSEERNSNPDKVKEEENLKEKHSVFVVKSPISGLSNTTVGGDVGSIAGPSCPIKGSLVAMGSPHTSMRSPQAMNATSPATPQSSGMSEASSSSQDCPPPHIDLTQPESLPPGGMAPVVAAPVAASAGLMSPQHQASFQQPYAGIYTNMMMSRRKPRTHIPPAARRRMEEIFTTTQYLSLEGRKALVDELNLEDEVIRVFFQNRRAAVKNKLRLAHLHENQ